MNFKNQLIKDINKLLRPSGFQRRGIGFYRQHGVCFQLLRIESASRSLDPKVISLVMSCNVHCPILYQMIDNMLGDFEYGYGDIRFNPMVYAGILKQSDWTEIDTDVEAKRFHEHCMKALLICLEGPLAIIKDVESYVEALENPRLRGPSGNINRIVHAYRTGTRFEYPDRDPRVDPV